MNKKLTKKQKKELEIISEEILDEAKKIVNDYTKNPSETSESIVRVHEKSPYLDTQKDSNEPLYSGSRWMKVIKSTI